MLNFVLIFILDITCSFLDTDTQLTYSIPVFSGSWYDIVFGSQTV